METPQTDAYDAVFDRALAGAKRALAAMPKLSRQAGRRLAEGFVGTRTEMALRNASIPLVDALVEYSTDLAGQDSSKAVEAAELAVAVANELDPAEYPTGGARLRAFTALIARSKDIADFRRGEQAIDEAWKIFREFNYSPDDEIDCLIATGYLYFTMDALEEVFFLAEDALNLARELEDPEREARAMQLLAWAQNESGEYEQAVDTLWNARRLTKNSRLRFACCQNLALNYCALGHYRAARSMLVQASACATRDMGRDYELRLLWVRARIDAHAGETSSVLATLKIVAEGFLNLGRPQMFAAAASEVALVLVEHGEWQDALKLANACVDWFKVLGMERNSVAAAAIAARVTGHRRVKRALLALAVSIKKRAGRQAPPLVR